MKQKMYRLRKKYGRGRPLKRKIGFERIFEKSLRKKAGEFLESGTPVATLTKGLLITAALGGVLAVGVVAPNLFKAFGMLKTYEKRSKCISQEGFSRLRRGCYQLLERGFIEPVSTDDEIGGPQFQLTAKGKEEIEHILGIKRIDKKAQGKINILRPPIWDGKWRLILFDIPIDFNNARDALRYGLRMFGCYQIQQSVWVHPFPCAQEIKQIASELGIKGKVEVYVAENFDHKKAIVSFHDLLKGY